MSNGNTQHFCLFLKNREVKRNLTVGLSISSDDPFNHLIKNARERCFSCGTKLSRYNGDDLCFSCKENQKERWLGEIEQRTEARSISKKDNFQNSVPITLLRSCAGLCRGNIQIIHGEVIPALRIIKLEPIQAINNEGNCGQCGGRLILVRDWFPFWAKNFKVIPSRRISVIHKKAGKAMSGGVEL